jgi:hypothetical protein
MKPNCLRVISLLALASVALTAQVARQDNVVPLKNWLVWGIRGSGFKEPMQLAASGVEGTLLIV